MEGNWYFNARAAFSFDAAVPLLVHELNQVFQADLSCDWRPRQIDGQQKASGAKFGGCECQKQFAALRVLHKLSDGAGDLFGQRVVAVDVQQPLVALYKRHHRHKLNRELKFSQNCLFSLNQICARYSVIIGIRKDLDHSGERGLH